jgi:hypothetical protein
MACKLCKDTGESEKYVDFAKRTFEFAPREGDLAKHDGGEFVACPACRRDDYVKGKGFSIPKNTLDAQLERVQEMVRAAGAAQK